MGNRYSWLLLFGVLSTSVTGIIVGYDLCVIAKVLNCIESDYQLCDANACTGCSGASGSTENVPPPQASPVASVRTTLIVAILAPGAALGSLGAGVFADSFGRRASIMLADAFFIAGSLCFLINASYWSILLGRVILGAGVGVGFVVFSTYVPEIAPEEHRGKLVAFPDAALSLGCMLSYGITTIVPLSQWPMLVGAVGIVAVVQLVACLFLPESPRWLVRKGRKEEAVRTLLRLMPPPKHSKDSLSTLDALDPNSSIALQRSEHLRKCRAMVDTMEADIVSSRQVQCHFVMKSGLPSSKSLDNDELENDLAKGEPYFERAFPMASSAGVIEIQRHASLCPNERSAHETETTETSERSIPPAGRQKRSNSLATGGVGGLISADPGNSVNETYENLSTTPNTNSREHLSGQHTTKRGVLSTFLSTLLSAWEASKMGCHTYSILCWKYRVPISIAVGCAVAQNLTLANTIISYTIPILRRASIPSLDFLSVGIGIAKFLGVVSAILLVDRVGRRPLLFWGSIVTFLCHILFAIFFGVLVWDSSADFARWGLLLVMYSFIYAWNISWAGLMFVVASEVLPSAVRGIGISLTVATFWILSFVFQLTIGLIMNLLTVPGAFGLFAGMNLLSILFVVFCVKDLARVPLEEVGKAYID